MKSNVKLKTENGKLLIALFAFSVFHFPLSVVGQTGGTFDLSHSVIAAGGGSNSTGGTFNVSGTVGQAAAGTASGGGGFDLHGGFWFQNAAPTAAHVSISGQIKTADGRGIRNVRLTLVNAATGAIDHALSSTFGYYRFDNVRAGDTYIISVSSKRFTFSPDSRVISPMDDVTDADWIAQE